MATQKDPTSKSPSKAKADDKQNTKPVEGQQAVEQDGSDDPNATVIEPVAAMPMSSVAYPRLQEEHDKRQAEQDKDKG